MLGQYAARHTIYIGADGKILYIDREVKVATAGADIAARLEQLGLP
jgi:peroxiredoxin Q/BCP